MPRPTRNSACVVVPRWTRPARTAAALHRGHVDVGGQVLPADVAIRIVVDALPNVGEQRPVASPSRIVELAGRVAVVDQEQQAPVQAGCRVGDPRVDARGRSRRAGRRRASIPSRASRAASAGVVGSASTSTNRPSPRSDEDLEQAAIADHDSMRRAARPAPRWRGRPRRSVGARSPGSTSDVRPTRRRQRSAIVSRRRGSTSIGS